MEVSTRKLVCHEIWGGAEKADQLIEFGAFRGRLLSLPYESIRGGDIHYLSFCDQEMLSKIVIADVAGHGEMVADIALELRSLLRQNIDETDNSKLLMSLNDSLSHKLKEGKFVTMVAATFHETDGSFIYAYAGHPTVLRYDAAKAYWQPLCRVEHGASGAPLGVIGGAEYFQATAKLFSGDMLLFYTDGLLDMKTRDNRHINASSLIELCREVTPISPDPDTVMTSLMERLEQIGDFADDVTSLIVQVK